MDTMGITKVLNDLLKRVSELEAKTQSCLGHKDNSNLNELFIGENPPPKSPKPSFNNKKKYIAWVKDIVNNTYKYIAKGWLSTGDISKLLSEAKSEYGNIEIHVAPSTCALAYRNFIGDNLLMWNLKLICDDNEVFQALADINNGSFDLKNRKYWINSNESIDIVINKSVEKGFSYIASNNEIVGYFEHAGI